jgi:hypothetical protein
MYRKVSKECCIEFNTYAESTKIPIRIVRRLIVRLYVEFLIVEAERSRLFPVVCIHSLWITWAMDYSQELAQLLHWEGRAFGHGRFAETRMEIRGIVPHACHSMLNSPHLETRMEACATVRHVCNPCVNSLHIETRIKVQAIVPHTCNSMTNSSHWETRTEVRPTLWWVLFTNGTDILPSHCAGRTQAILQWRSHVTHEPKACRIKQATPCIMHV